MQHAVNRSLFALFLGLLSLSLCGQAALARDTAAATKLQLQAVVDSVCTL